MDISFESIKSYTTETEDGCWEWQRARSSAGYGQAWDGDKVVYTHRVMCGLIYGDPMNNGEVLHKCDNPACCNPDHLSWGTRFDNVKDMRRKGRARYEPPKGESHGMSKLKEDEVIQIKIRRAMGEVYRTIAKSYGVSISTIHLICQGKLWREV